MISDITKLGISELTSILNSGFSRVPVFHKNDRRNIVGFLLIKSLVILSPSDYIGVDSLDVREPIILAPNVTLLEALSIFRKGQKAAVHKIRAGNGSQTDDVEQVYHSHMALVAKNPIKALNRMRSMKNKRGRVSSIFQSTGYDDNDSDGMILGIVTLEDVIEKIIQEDITDETDVVISKSNKTYTNNVNNSFVVGSSSLIHQKFKKGAGTKQDHPKRRSSNASEVALSDVEAGVGTEEGGTRAGRRRASLTSAPRGRLSLERTYSDKVSDVKAWRRSSGSASRAGKHSDSGSNSDSNNVSRDDASYASALNCSGGSMWLDENGEESDSDVHEMPSGIRTGTGHGESGARANADGDEALAYETSSLLSH
jgi:hypothetical protein